MPSRSIPFAVDHGAEEDEQGEEALDRPGRRAAWVDAGRLLAVELGVLR